MTISSSSSACSPSTTSYEMHLTHAPRRVTVWDNTYRWSHSDAPPVALRWLSHEELIVHLIHVLLNEQLMYCVLLMKLVTLHIQAVIVSVSSPTDTERRLCVYLSVCLYVYRLSEAGERGAHLSNVETSNDWWVDCWLSVVDSNQLIIVSDVTFYVIQLYQRQQPRRRRRRRW